MLKVQMYLFSKNINELFLKLKTFSMKTHGFKRNHQALNAVSNALVVQK